MFRPLHKAAAAAAANLNNIIFVWLFFKKKIEHQLSSTWSIQLLSMFQSCSFSFLLVRKKNPLTCYVDSDQRWKEWMHFSLGEKLVLVFFPTRFLRQRHTIESYVIRALHLNVVTLKSRYFFLSKILQILWERAHFFRVSSPRVSLSLSVFFSARKKPVTN